MSDLTVHGLKELQRDLRTLPRKIQGRVVRNATRAGAVVARRKAKETAPVGTGQLKKDVVLRSRRTNNRHEVRVSVGVKQTSFYGMFQEFGTRFMAARPWLRPAFDSTKDEAHKTIAERIWLEVQRVMK